jgi:transcriptional regulator with XRE-family HTH domain
MATAPAPSARFGALLKHYRRAAGLTQEVLAEQARLSVRGIQDLERGVSQAPRPDTVALLAAALGLAPEERAELLAAAHRRSLARAQPAPAIPVTPGPLVPLVGRGRELALLAQFLAGADDVGPAAPLLMLAGEPGIGKTRLLQAAAQQAIAHGWAVLAGGCHRRGGQEPYAPLLDALAQHLHAQSPERLRTVLVGCAWLVRLLPELVDVLEPLRAGTLAPEQERRLLFAAVARVLANVAGPAGTLLVLDDLQ